MTYWNHAQLLGAALLALLPAAAVAAQTVPAGTPIQIRTVTPIDSSKGAPGERYLATVSDPVVVGNTVVIPRGANASVELLKTGSGNYVLKLYDITVNGRPYEVASSSAEVKGTQGKKAAKRGILGGGVGAAIGAIAGGGTGAAIGAATGGGVGAASGAISGKRVQVAPETLLTFELRAPVTIQSAG